MKHAVLLLTLSVSTGAVLAQQAEVASAADLEAATRVVGAPRGRPLSGERLDAETQRVAGLLRCPVCQGSSVADSPAPTAVNMRNQVRELLAAGFQEDQVLAYFERSYGEFVRLEPPMRGVNWSLWLAPLAGLLLGGGVVWWMLRGAGRAPAAQAREALGPSPACARPPTLDPLPEDAQLAEYVKRVRALAYGWPEGVRPKGTDPQ